MLINCPSCGKRMSNKNPACPECGFDFRHTGQGVPLEEAARRASRKRADRLRAHAYLALLVALIGLAWTWFSTGALIFARENPGSWLLSAGALWYVVTRIRILWARRAS